MWTKKDFRIEWFSGKGAGGQHRNKHQNCVRVIHIESGLSCTGQSYRERKRNFEEAFRSLAEKLHRHYYPKHARDREPVTAVIRSYNECENRIVDHVTGNKYSMDSFDLDEEIREKLSMLYK